MVDLIPVMVLTGNPKQGNDRPSELRGRFFCRLDGSDGLVYDKKRTREQTALLAGGNNQRTLLLQKRQRIHHCRMGVPLQIILP
ncbi:hypothetical protein D3C73_1376200 [compost metagenome]